MVILTRSQRTDPCTQEGGRTPLWKICHIGRRTHAPRLLVLVDLPSIGFSIPGPGSGFCLNSFCIPPPRNRFFTVSTKPARNLADFMRTHPPEAPPASPTCQPTSNPQPSRRGNRQTERGFTVSSRPPSTASSAALHPSRRGRQRDGGTASSPAPTMYIIVIPYGLYNLALFLRNNRGNVVTYNVSNAVYNSVSNVVTSRQPLLPLYGHGNAVASLPSLCWSARRSC